VNTAPCCGVYSVKPKTKLSDNRQYSIKTKGCNTYIHTSLAWRCENLFAHQSSPSPSHTPLHCSFTPVEPGYGVDLSEDDYLLLLAADLQSIGFPLRHPLECANRNVFFDSTYTVEYLTTRREFFFFFFFFHLHVEQFVFVFVFLLFCFFVFCGLGRSGEVLIIINGTI
jgi:hypothetical protein